MQDFTAVNALVYRVCLNDVRQANCMIQNTGIEPLQAVLMLIMWSEVSFWLTALENIPMYCRSTLQLHRYSTDSLLCRWFGVHPDSAEPSTDVQQPARPAHEVRC